MAVKALRHRRPIRIASYGKPSPVRDDRGPEKSQPDESAQIVADEPPAPPKLRHAFPAAGEERHGGRSDDGYCFRLVFSAGRLASTYTMVREFLAQEGYGPLPLPANVAELRAFRLPSRQRQQLALFGDDGYVHNPIKILFPPKGGKAGSLVLEVYNEAAPDHLLRFHGRKR